MHAAPFRRDEDEVYFHLCKHSHMKIERQKFSEFYFMRFLTKISSHKK